MGYRDRSGSLTRVARTQLPRWFYFLTTLNSDEGAAVGLFSGSNTVDDRLQPQRDRKQNKNNKKQKQKTKHKKTKKQKERKETTQKNIIGLVDGDGNNNNSNNNNNNLTAVFQSIYCRVCEKLMSGGRENTVVWRS